MKRTLFAVTAALVTTSASPAAAQVEMQTGGWEIERQGVICTSDCYLWQTDEYWAMDFFSSSLASVGRLTASLNIAENVLNSGASILFSAFVNGFSVGAFTISEGDPTGVLPLDFLFAPVSASDYRVEFRITGPSVPNSQGSVLLDGPTSSVSIYSAQALPEPGTLAMMLMGLVGLVLLRGRREEMRV